MGRALELKPALMTLSDQSAGKFAVMHKGARDVVAYGRRPTGGLGETPSYYQP
jgi:hypothetical protein